MKTDSEYRELLDNVGMALRQANLFLQMMSVEELIAARDTVERAEAFGPIFHPSEWIKANHKKTLEIQRLLISAALSLKASIVSITKLQQEAKELEAAIEGART